MSATQRLPRTRIPKAVAAAAGVATATVIVTLICCKDHDIMHLGQPNSKTRGSSMVNFKRVGESKRGPLDPPPLSNSAGPYIRSSSQLHMPGFEGSLLFLVNGSKNVRSKLIGFASESTLKFRKSSLIPSICIYRICPMQRFI